MLRRGAAGTPGWSAHGSYRSPPRPRLWRGRAGRRPAPAGRWYSPPSGQAFPSAARRHILAPKRGARAIMVAGRKTESDAERRAKLVKAAGAVGIGSAAIVAALLYASTIRKKPR